jgi:hypothetical protein
MRSLSLEAHSSGLVGCRGWLVAGSSCLPRVLYNCASLLLFKVHGKNRVWLTMKLVAFKKEKKFPECKEVQALPCEGMGSGDVCV